MPPRVTCHCALCDIERRLLSDLSGVEAAKISELFSPWPNLQHFSSLRSLLAHLRTSPTDSRSDTLFSELFALREKSPAFVESLLVLVFLPMLHRTIRLIARRQENLAEEDVTQQALSFHLQFLRSAELRSRRSHFAFAVSRSVKRKLFQWANRESIKAAPLYYPNEEAPTFPTAQDTFERYVLLRHFLHRCVIKGLLTDPEVHLLIQFKLDGNTSEEFASLNGSSPNAVRQKFKRMLAKLRRLAI